MSTPHESDKRLQRIGWVNEGIEVLHRRAVPQEGVRVHIAAVVDVARHLPRALMATPRLARAPQRAEVQHRRAVPQEGVTTQPSAVADEPVTCPASLMATPLTIAAPQRAEVLHRRAVPQEGVNVPSPAVMDVARHLPRGVDGSATS